MWHSTANLYFKSKKVSLLILAVTAMLCSRTLFLFFNDPEGPNLLIVTVLALAVFLFSYAIYVFSPIRVAGVTRLLAAIGVQIVSVVVLYFCM